MTPEYIYGKGSRHLVAQYANNFGLTKVLLVTDECVKNDGWSDEIKKTLLEAGIEVIVYDDVSPNPRDYQVMNGVKFFEENRCDAIVAVCSGSVWSRSEYCF